MGIDQRGPIEEGLPDNPEAEFSENRIERLRARAIELLRSDIEAVVAALEASTVEDEEDFEIEVSMDTLESGDVDQPLTPEEIASIREVFGSEEAKSIYAENNLQLLNVDYKPDHLHGEEKVLNILLHIVHEEPGELSGEFLKVRFSNRCAHCKAAGEENNEIVVEETVPKSLAGKWKKTKGKEKEKGLEYRDWDYGEVPCPKCEERGKPSKVMLYYREYK